MRTLCPHPCKVPDPTLTRDGLNDMLKHWRLGGGVRPYKPVGCLECRNTGFRGRAGLYEPLTVSESIKAAMHPRPTCPPPAASRRAGGHAPAASGRGDEDRRGLTTLEESAAAPRPGAIESWGRVSSATRRFT